MRAVCSREFRAVFKVQRQVKEITTRRGFPGLYPVKAEEIFLLSHILQIFVVMLDVEFIVLFFCFMKNLPLEGTKVVKKI